jgi:hypothetical protein
MSALLEFDLQQTVVFHGKEWEFTGGILGTGAYGQVYDAECVTTGERAAVKVLNTSAMTPWLRNQTVAEVNAKAMGTYAPQGVRRFSHPIVSSPGRRACGSCSTTRTS